MINTLKNKLKKQFVGLGRWLGFDALSREETVAFLATYCIAAHPADQTLLPAVDDFADRSKRIFDATEAVTEPACVWRYDKPDHKKAMLLRCGALYTEGKVMCADWRGDRRLLTDITSLRARPTHRADVLIAPWSHYLDGVRFGGYYDFVALIVAKLCRIKEALGADAFSRAVVAYPLFGTAYERELLNRIGFSDDRIFDSRLTNVQFKTCVLGNSGHWFYPNVADLLALKRQAAGGLAAVPSQSGPRLANRVYISRAGRRRILNEDALITLLRTYDFDIIEDKPRTVAEQVNIYRNASFIIGPHGASFTNILWSEPGTHLVELFTPRYVPAFFPYMAHRLGLRYAAYQHGPISSERFSGLDEDIEVSIPDLERSLNALFKTETAEG